LYTPAERRVRQACYHHLYNYESEFHYPILVTVDVAPGFEAMPSPTAKFNVVKIGLRSIRVVGEAATHGPAQHPTKA
jgi:hypothetical protein